jgi:hypothetical protein
VFRAEVAEVQFQDVIEIPEHQAVDDPSLTLRQMVEKKLKLVPAPSARSMPLVDPVVNLGRSSDFTIVGLSAKPFGFLFNHLDADTVSRLESTKQFSSGHIFSFVARAEFSRRAKVGPITLQMRRTVPLFSVPEF